MIICRRRGWVALVLERAIWSLQLTAVLAFSQSSKKESVRSLIELSICNENDSPSR